LKSITNCSILVTTSGCLFRAGFPSGCPARFH
jgi:hypothetical protein